MSGDSTPDSPPLIFHLKPGEEKRLLEGHPWVFANEVSRVEGKVSLGAVGEVRAFRGAFVGRGVVNPASKILVRLLARDPAEAVDARLVARRVREAVERRRGFGEAHRTNAVRLVYAESDGLPGITADRYGGVAVVACTSAGMRPLLPAVAEVLREAGCRGVYERSTGEVLRREGIPDTEGWLTDPVPPPWPFEEDDCTFLLDPSLGGHKSGFYLDVRRVRGAFARRASGGRLLDAFSYTGAAAVRAARAGAAEVLAWDTSRRLIEEGVRNAQANGVSERIRFEVRDTFRDLSKLAAEEPASFDGVLLDPPPLARTVHEMGPGKGALVRLAEEGFRLVKRGGFLILTTCSHALGWNALEDAARRAAAKVRVSAHLEERITQPEDHPVHLSVPETEYLHALVLRKL